jgi:hypothetical protein
VQRGTQRREFTAIDKRAQVQRRVAERDRVHRRLRGLRHARIPGWFEALQQRGKRRIDAPRRLRIDQASATHDATPPPHSASTPSTSVRENASVTTPRVSPGCSPRQNRYSAPPMSRS